MCARQEREREREREREEKERKKGGVRTGGGGGGEGKEKKERIMDYNGNISRNASLSACRETYARPTQVLFSLLKLGHVQSSFSRESASQLHAH